MESNTETETDNLMHSSLVECWFFPVHVMFSLLIILELSEKEHSCHKSEQIKPNRQQNACIIC